MAKNSLKEVHTYAELKHDPRASLPDRFTICSTIMIPNCLSRAWPTFFAVLSNNRTQILSPIGSPASIVTHLKILYLQGASEQANGKIPPIFPNKWTRSCMAINTKSGLIHWVVEGTLIMATISEEVKNSKPIRTKFFLLSSCGPSLLSLAPDLMWSPMLCNLVK